MTIHLSILIFWPLVFGVAGAFVPRRAAPVFALVGALVPLGYAILMLFDFDVGRARAAVPDRRRVDPGPRHPLPARRRRAQPVAGGADDAAVRGLGAVAGPAPAAARVAVRAALRDRRDGRAGRVPGAGPRRLRPLLRPDAGAVLLPGRDLGRPRSHRGGGEDGRLHAGRLAADAGRRGGDRGAVRARAGRAELRVLRPRRQPAAREHAEVDLRRLRARVPDQDAGVPVPRLDARRLPRDAAAGAGRLLRRGLQGRRLRLPARGAAAVPGRRATTSRRSCSCSPCCRSSTAR